MRIAHLVMSMHHGGAERLASDLAYSSMKNGNDVKIFSLLQKGEGKGFEATEKGKELNIVYINKKQGFDLSGIIRLSKALSDFKPDLVHTHIDSVIYAIPWLLLNPKASRVHTVHNIARKELILTKRIIMRFAYRFIGIIPVAISHAILESIISEYGIKKEKIPLIYNGIDTSYFKRHRQENNVFNLLHVGRYHPQKNHKLLIDSFSRVAEIKSNIRLILVGEGPLYDEIQSYINDIGLQEKIVMAGVTNDVAIWLNNADVFVLSSDYEGLPLSILEAFSCGLPVISTNVGGVPDIIDDGINGLLVPPGNITRLCDAILKITEDSELRRFFSENNLGKSVRYDIKNVCRNYENLYLKEIMKRNAIKAEGENYI